MNIANYLVFDQTDCMCLLTVPDFHTYDEVYKPIDIKVFHVP